MKDLAKFLVSTLLEDTITPSESKLTAMFGKHYERCPSQIQDMCHSKYHRWRDKPDSLKFEFKVNTPHGRLYSVHIDYNYHALCIVKGTVVTWLAVSAYQEYTRLMDQIRAEAGR